jgi:hypothetical protein
MLRPKAPAKPREAMKENERWAGHITFLTITSALAAALIAAFAVIFADPSKIPDVFAKILILLSALFVIVTLGFSLLASAHLSNYLVSSDQQSSAKRVQIGANITRAAGAAFFSLFISGVLLLAFLFWVVLFTSDGNPTQSSTDRSPPWQTEGTTSPGKTPSGTTPPATVPPRKWCPWARPHHTDRCFRG